MVCEICGARFMTNYNLRGHMKKHMREESYRVVTCKVCLGAFDSHAQLEHHNQMVHPDSTLDSEPLTIRLDATQQQEHYDLTHTSPIVYHTGVKNEVEIRSEALVYPVLEENEKTHLQQHSILIQGDSGVEEQVEGVACIKTEGEEGVEVVGARQQLSVIHVYECSDCAAIFSSLNLFNAHREAFHGNSRSFIS